jgi:hypothetical protein
VRKYLWIFAFFLLVGSAHAESNFTFSGYIKNETSLRAVDFNGDLQKQKEIIMLSGEYKIREDLVFFAKTKYWYDFAYAARDKLDIAAHYMEHIQRTDWLRDCYLDYTKGPWFLRLGKQQVAWGQADGITILDRVNPFDISEYVLPDMEDIRIPLWMFNINYSPKLNSNLQFLFIPDFEQSTSAPIGAPFCTYAYIRYDDLKKLLKRIGGPFGGGKVDENIYFPGTKFKNSTFALQWSDRIGDLDYTLNFLNGFYYSARNYTIQLPGVVNYKVERAFKSYRMYGSSFNKSFTNPGPIQGVTLRGDFALYNDEPTYIGDPIAGASKRIARWNNIFWLIGADKYVFTKWLLSGQFAQYILEHGKDKSGSPELQNNPAWQYPMSPSTYGFADAVENIFTLKISTSSGFMNDRLKPEILWSFTDDNQGKLSPKVSYEIKDNLVATVGYHYFYGNLFDSNGQYKEQSQFYVNLKYSF